jgi:restriction system protein
MAARGGAYDHERFRRQLEREAAREQAAREREAEKAAKEQYLQSRQDGAARRTEEATRALADLDELLRRSLIDPVGPPGLTALKQPAPVLPLHLSADAEPSPAPEWVEYAPPPPGPMGRLLGGDLRTATDAGRESISSRVLT